MQRTRWILIVAGGLAALLVAPAMLAHGPVARKAEAAAGQIRLFTSDSATGEVIVVDLPAGEVVTRLATPPHILSLGLSQDGRHLFALRGRNTNRDTVTVIDTGAAGSVDDHFTGAYFLLKKEILPSESAELEQR